MGASPTAHAAEDQGFSVFARACPSRSALQHVTGRWGSLTIAALADAGPVRFNELRRRVDGISQKILAQTLQTLERDGIVHRDVISAFPLHVEYSLTPLGSELAAKLLDLFRLLASRMPSVLQAQNRYDLSGPATPRVGSGEGSAADGDAAGPVVSS